MITSAKKTFSKGVLALAVLGVAVAVAPGVHQSSTTNWQAAASDAKASGSQAPTMCGPKMCY